MNYLRKVLNVINVVAQGDITGGSVIEVSEKSGIPMSSSHRILNDLVECDILTKNDDTRKYRLSPRIVPLVQEIYWKMNLDALKRILTELRDQINETVFLSELTDNGVTSIMAVESNRVFRFRARSGVYLPVHCTAAGLAIVAYIDPAKAEKLMCLSHQNGDDLAVECPVDVFSKRLERVREDGYAFCDKEYEPGLQALAVPVFDRRGLVSASITSIAPGQRFTEKSTKDPIIKFLRQAALEISKYSY